jgi:vancomycin resistance protein YoaR
MTRKLEELFDMPQADPDSMPSFDSTISDIETNMSVLPNALSTLDKIESALPAVRGLEASDVEMDDLAKKAVDSYDNLMDLGMNVDSRYASEIFSVASQMLGHAITAKTAKLNKKLKMIDLQLKKAKLDQVDDSAAKIPSAEGRMLDRNDLLRQLQQDAEKPNDGK